MTQPTASMNQAAASPTSKSVSRVFPSVPRIDRYFPGAAIEGSRRAVVDCVTRGDGPALVIGAPGVGKSLLLDMVAQAVGDRGAVVRLASTQICTRRALLQAMLFAMGKPYRDREEGELRLAVIEGLRSLGDRPLGAVLIVDEAQLLSVKLLDELRMLGDLVTEGGEPAVRLVIAGGPTLDELLAAAELEPLCQRIATRCYVTPLSYDETQAYVRSHLSAAGRSPDRFSSAAIDLLFRATDGVPRLLNQLSQRLVDLPADPIEPLQVQQAWSELHQLPAPWYTPEVAAAPTPSPHAGVEFGELEDLDVVEEEEPTEAAAAITPAPAPVAQAPDPSPSRASSYNADEALATLPPSPPVVDPFGEGWEEEELVIDRYASLGAAFHTSTPFVVNRLDGALAENLARLTSEPETLPEPAEPIDTLDEGLDADDEPLPIAEASFQPTRSLAICGEEPCDGARVCSGVGAYSGDTELDELDDDFEEEYFPTISANPSAGDADDETILVIEREVEPFEATPEVRRSEYRRLFANLRGAE
ncbi:hypothetical protein Pla175_45650 [Pirellulimonas nuda]|uniref:AAA+ ATPase domain-containing protein n=1 Tax=Pirellulimonas nuda TaxID=2528009 RepID=A0A518DI53_9BACT|nr:AAA family ATPase [Pirellulimonas nuda]QDU91145.1 hypothetical protein Pla175_45650 [Pirellulimonas nuda]